MTKKLNDHKTIFENMEEHWTHSQEIFTNWQHAAQDFWKAYTAWWEHVFRNDLDKDSK